jgi:hypothetical protein
MMGKGVDYMYAVGCFLAFSCMSVRGIGLVGMFNSVGLIIICGISL